MFFSDGDMEREGLRRHFGIRAKPIGNGKSVSMDAMVRQISTELILSDELVRVFIMFDREGRVESAQELADTLVKKLESKFPDREFHVAVSNCDIECWLFADHEICTKHFGRKIGAKSRFEGRKGADALKKYIGQGRYEKMIDGVSLMGKVRWKIIEARSESARNAKLSKFFPDCSWLEL